MQLFKLKEWTGNIRGDLLAGILVALALIPEAISFSIIAGVDPKVGLYASFIIAIVTAIFGGRPGMISAATAATALLMTHLVTDYDNGLQYLLAASILAGILQLFWGVIKIAKQLKFVSRAVMIGFVNALAILIFTAQLPELSLDNPTWITVYAMVAGALAIIYLLPRFTTVIPSPLIAIIIITIISVVTNSGVPTVGDRGELPSTLPGFGIPEVPFNFETLQIIFPYAIAISLVGLLESFLTANVVDDLTDTPSNKNKEALAQGIANFVSGLFGGMAGCAMIGQSVINIKSGGRTRLSTLSAGVFLLLFMLFLGTQVEKIPMAALVAIMIMVSIGTFNWSSMRQIRKIPRSETAVMVTTVVMTIFSHNLAIGVLSGVTLNALLFSRKIAQLVFVDSVIDSQGEKRVYSVAGQIFFVSVNQFLQAFDFKEDVELVKIDLTHAHLWDQSAIAALDKVVINFRRNGADVEVVGLNKASATLVDKLAVHDKLDSFEDLASH
ncbi:SulP family inorganic anion transporter [Pleurocapsa sp. PCC 7319]|uniref:SulP family inorganic anion transporter n=1 Tax=Pleurocapsa sp. PCC 7319 TaxID=118161 RepID=UPI00034B5BC9|nr:SulP family inorganic anion transporter [Pleurocapsa sp. PCC 7319]